MTKSLSGDLRGRVIAAIEEGLSTRKAARRFRIGIATAGSLVSPLSRDGRDGGAQAGPAAGFEARSARSLHSRPDRGDAGHHARRDRRETGGRARRAGCCFDGVDVPRQARHHVQKKTAHASEQQRPDVKARRSAWFDGQLDLDPEKLIFIDETGASTKMARLRGRSLRGERCMAAVPHGHWKTTTFTAGLRLAGMTAPMLLDGPMNGEAFLAYAEQVLAPELRPVTSSSWTICRPTRSPACARPSRRPAQGCCSCRPIRPISIQSRWPSRNSRLCSERPPHDTVDELWSVIAECLAAFKADECRNYFKAAGYEPE